MLFYQPTLLFDLMLRYIQINIRDEIRNENLLEKYFLSFFYERNC